MTVDAGAAGEWRGRPVLVTGGAGFIGSHLVAELVARRARVRVLDDLSTGLAENLGSFAGEIELVRASVTDLAACAAACEGVEVVFHQAALGSVPRSLADPARTIAVNVAGTANVFAAARDAGARRVVYASSSSVYGDSDVLPRREGEEGRPLSPYAASKAMDEELADVFARSFAMEICGLRYFNVYGPRQRPDGPYAAVVPRFLAAAFAGEPAAIDGDGEQSRDFTFVADAVAANLAAATARLDRPAPAVNVGAGGATTVRELAAAIAAAVAARTGRRPPPPVHGPPRAGDVRHSLADLDRARALLGYRPRHDLATGLAATVAAWAMD